MNLNTTWLLSIDHIKQQNENKNDMKNYEAQKFFSIVNDLCSCSLFELPYGNIYENFTKF